MLENPYFAAPLNLPTDQGGYLGEGLIEESADGSEISLWYESTLQDSFNASLSLAKLIGVFRQLRRAQWTSRGLGTLSLLLLILMYFSAEEPTEPPQSNFLLFLGVIGFAFLVVIPWLVMVRYKRSLRGAIVAIRGTTGSFDMQVKLAPAGVRTQWLDQESLHYWRGVREVALSPQGVNILCTPAGVVHVPLRVFPDPVALERFVLLARKYIGARPA